MKQDATVKKTFVMSALQSAEKLAEILILLQFLFTHHDLSLSLSSCHPFAESQQTSSHGAISNHLSAVDPLLQKLDCGIF